MKPHEETWEADGDRLFIADGDPVGTEIADFDESCAHPDKDEARAKLAAQAPAMARLLLQMSKYGVCPGCCRGGNEHWPKCTIVATLAAAGVLDAAGAESGRR